MSNAERLVAKEAAERQLVTGRLAALLTRTPKEYATWSYQRVRAYKEAVERARRLLKMPKPALRSLREAASELQQFHPLNLL